MFKLLILMTLLFAQCSSTETEGATDDPIKPPVELTNDMDLWVTKGDRSLELEKQTTILSFGTKPNTFSKIEVSESQSFQSIDGFGFTLTGGSAEVINKLNATKKEELLKELFGTSENSISLSYLRISIGASDLNSYPFTYNDLASGETDLNLEKFSLEPDAELIGLLKEILAINPNINILGSPWTAPLWMKDNDSFIGGSLQPKYYDVYAQYFVKYIQAMKAGGIDINAITIQNEPMHDGNNPSMYMTALEQANFIKNSLGPAFETANINTKIIIWDHNCDNPQYPISILNDTGANPYVYGSAFHLYNGDISALSTVHNAFPDKNLYFTEQYTSSTGEFSGDLKWHLKNVVIGSTRNWSKVALEWNLANDGSFGPHTDGGCTVCKGAITINSTESYKRNVAYYVIGHASKFVPSGSKRIVSNIVGSLNNVAFKTPEGKIVLIVENDGNTSEVFNIKYKDEWVVTALDAGAVGTYVW